MGDVIHALPMAENARASGAAIGWVVERRFSGLLESNPNVDRVFVADTREWRRRPLHSDTRRDAEEMSRLDGRCVLVGAVEPAQVHVRIRRAHLREASIRVDP